MPALNTLTAAFHPDRVNRSVLMLNTLLGLGTALAPVFVAVFVGLGFWWGLPLLSTALRVVSARGPRSRSPPRSGSAPTGPAHGDGVEFGPRILRQVEPGAGDVLAQVGH